MAALMQFVPERRFLQRLRATFMVALSFYASFDLNGQMSYNVNKRNWRIQS